MTNKEKLIEFIEDRRFAFEGIFELINKYSEISQNALGTAGSFNEISSILRSGGYIEASNEAQEIANNTLNIAEMTLAQKEAFNMLATSILTFARQAIEKIHDGNVDNEITTANFGDRYHLDKIIINSRNQAMHCEENDITNTNTITFFSDLESTKSYYRGFQTENKAIYIIEDLGWFTFDKFKNDMESLYN